MPKCFAERFAVGRGYAPVQANTGYVTGLSLLCALAAECPEFTPPFSKTPCPPKPTTPALTSATLHAAPFPAAVGPDEQRVLGLFGLTLIFSSVVYRNGVFIMNSIILVMK